MTDVSMVELLLVVLLVTNIIIMIIFVWAVLYIESSIRDDLKKYHSELTLEQIEKAINFADTLKHSFKKEK
jgi:hypothetical protein